jgi:hypothetical protein
MPVFFPFEDQGQAAEYIGGPAASNNEAGSANPTSIFARVDATLREAEEVS